MTVIEIVRLEKKAIKTMVLSNEFTLLEAVMRVRQIEKLPKTPYEVTEEKEDRIVVKFDEIPYIAKYLRVWEADHVL